MRSKGKRMRVVGAKLSAVIFDMDGLMLDTEAIYQIVWRNVGKALGFHMSDELLYATLGRPAHDCYRLLLETHGPDFPLTAFRADCAEHWDSHTSTHGIAHKPGLLDLLDWLDAHGIPKAVATSTAYTKAVATLQTADIADRFQIIVTGDQIEHGKPAPDIFWAAAQKLGVDPRCCIALEDSEAGVIAASSAGMYTIMVPDIKQPTPEIEARAYRVLPSLHAVKALLAEEWLPLLAQ